MLIQKVKMAALTAAGLMAAFVGPVWAVPLNGAGSSFAYPIYAKWGAAYHEMHPDMTLNYQSIGSGAGIAQYKAGTVDFGATDLALNDVQLRAMPEPTACIPTVARAVVMAYHINGVGAGLRLSGDVIVSIYEGNITSWNDPRIQKENPNIKLPAEPITVAHRSDGSGTTSIFTNYLSAVSATWREKIGAGTTVDWPCGLGGPQNPGVAGIVKNTPGGIGYVELAYAITTHLTYAELRNRAGNYIAASIASTTAAADASAAMLAKDVRTPFVNALGAHSYPIAGFTYVIFPRTFKDHAKGAEFKRFLEWGLGPEGEKMAETLYYAPLARPILELDHALLAKIH